MDDNLQFFTAPDPNQIYSFQQPRPQHFSISYSIIKYMFQNPQLPKAWKKLIKTCKYFYSKNRIYPVSRIIVSDINFGDTGIAKDSYSNDEVLINPVVYNPNGTRLWACGTLWLESVNALSALIPKIFKFDLHCLRAYKSNITWNEYQKLTSCKSIETIDLEYGTIVKNFDGTIVTMDRLLENLENVHFLTMHCSNNSLLFKSDTIKNMIDRITEFKDIWSFTLTGIPENFDIDAFKPFLMTNKTIHIELCFPTRVSTAFKNIIKNFVNEIKENPSIMAPSIDFAI